MNNHFEKHYSILDDSEKKYGLVTLGPMASFTWNNDPRRLLFVLSRYKFVASVLHNEKNVLEIGCGDGFGSRIVAQSVNNLTVTDVDTMLLDAARLAGSAPFPFKVEYLDILAGPCKTKYTASYLLDVLEHIAPKNQATFLQNIALSVEKNGKVIFGMPSIESQKYASPGSIAGHVNCQSKEELHETLKQFFSSVTVFSMNDEVVHTGYKHMSHYLIALCIV
jgi:2-polyprenyl-3-methyl-5-hydroxy-6-metoxy-1,4-benzoquinol methylase